MKRKNWVLFQSQILATKKGLYSTNAVQKGKKKSFTALNALLIKEKAERELYTSLIQEDIFFNLKTAHQTVLSTQNQSIACSLYTP